MTPLERQVKVLREGLEKIAKGYIDDRIPESGDSFGNYDDVFYDGIKAGEHYAGETAKETLAEADRIGAVEDYCQFRWIDRGIPTVCGESIPCPKHTVNPKPSGGDGEATVPFSQWQADMDSMNSWVNYWRARYKNAMKAILSKEAGHE